MTPAFSFSAGLSAACAPAQQASAHGPEGDNQIQIRQKKEAAFNILKIKMFCLCRYHADTKPLNRFSGNLYLLV